MLKYKFTNYGSVFKIIDDKTIANFIPGNGGLMDEEYQQWLSIPGNTPDPADPVIPSPRMKDKEDIYYAVDAIGKLDTLLAFFAANPKIGVLWYSGRQEVSADPPDQRVVGALTAAGLSESEIITVLGA